MKEWLSKNWFRAGILLIVAIVGISIMFSNSIKPILNDKRLDKCLREAEQHYRERWISYCRIDQIPLGKDGFCLLPSERADRVRDENRELQEICFKKYS